VILPEEYPNVMDALRERHAAACADRDGRVGRAGERLAELRARLIAIDAEINIESVLAADGCSGRCGPPASTRRFGRFSAPPASIESGRRATRLACSSVRAAGSSTSASALGGHD
jgi:hypothetical protein